MRKIKEYFKSLGARPRASETDSSPRRTIEGIRTGPQKEQSNESDTIVFKRKKTSRPEIKETLKVTKGIDSGREFLLISSPMKIGRHIENYINLTDPKVSRDHALLEYNALRKQFIIKDLGSTNGTYINNHKIKKREKVGPGDAIRIGDTTLEIAAFNRK